MSLSDFSSSMYSFYDDAQNNGIIDFDVITSQNFESGKRNTLNMIAKWNSETYGNKNTCSSGYKDIWGEIQEQVNDGWFIPSKEEWTKFNKATGIDLSYNSYIGKNLSDRYMSSSLNNSISYYINENEDGMYSTNTQGHPTVDGSSYVRLATTF